MTKILSIDPSSNRYKSSTTGIVLLDNATLIDYWVVSYGVENFKKWFSKVGQSLDYDQVIVEEYDVREGERRRDNTTKETMECVLSCYPNCITRNNSGYKTDIPDELLKRLNLWEFKDKKKNSNHHDVRAAARLALFHAMRENIYDVVQDIGKRALGSEKENLNV